MIDPPRFRLLAAVGLVAGCGLALQVVLSRLLGAALFYHFTFLVISLALLGTGVAGLLLYVFPRWFRLDLGVDRAFGRWARYFGVSASATYMHAILPRGAYAFNGAVPRRPHGPFFPGPSPHASAPVFL